jgi:tetratricopeptide (TPR) repeat protein
VLVPHPLVFIYPRWIVDAGDWRSYWPMVVVLAVAIAVLVAFFRGRRGPAVAVAFFVVTVFPALGFVDYWPMVYSFVADHFSYLASIGLIALAVAPLAKRFGSIPAAKVLAGAVLLVLAGLVWGEGQEYANEETLWRKTIADNPGAWMAYNNLGVVFLRDHGRLGDAVDLMRRGDAHRAVQVLETSSTQELHDLARRLLALPPNRDAQAADEMERMRQPLIDQAIEQFKASLHIDPDNYQAMGNLAVAMHRLGRYEEALEYWQALVAHGNATSDDRYRMGLTLEKLGRTDDAIADYEEVLKEAPEHLGAHLQLGELLAQEGRHDEAEAQFEFLVARYPGSVSLQLYLGGRAETKGDWAKAIDNYRTALKYAQDPSQAVELTKRLAAIRAMCPDRQFRNASVAIQLVEPLLRTSEQRDPTVLHTLAAAFADMGRFDDAVRTAEEALALAREKGMTQLVAELEPRLEAYRAGRADPD